MVPKTKKLHSTSLWLIALSTWMAVGAFIVRNATAADSTGVFHSFAANRLASTDYHLPDSNATMAAFWDAVRGSLGGDSTFCASSAPKVLAISIVDSAAIERNVPGCEQYSTNGKIVRGLSLSQIEATLDGEPLAVIRHPNSGAERFDTLINPNDDAFAIASCDDFIADSGGTRLKGDQCYGLTYAADVTSLAPGEHDLVVEFIHPDPFCGGVGTVEATVTIDPNC